MTNLADTGQKARDKAERVNPRFCLQGAGGKQSCLASRAFVAGAFERREATQG
jgi:hypothetical protein